MEYLHLSSPNASNIFLSLMLSLYFYLVHLLDKVKMFGTIKQIIMQEFQIPSLNPVLISKIQNEYSRIFERKASLKLSGVKKRNFYHWKEEGVIDWKSESDDDKRSWVRLNIYDFIWVKIVQAARDFGVPMEAIRKLKDELFKDGIAYIQQNSEDFYHFHRDDLGTSEEEILKIKQFLASLDTHKEDIIAEGELHLISIFGSIIHETLFCGLHMVIVFKKVEDDYIHDFMCYSESYEKVPNLTEDLLKQPSVVIPIDALISEFMEGEDNLPNLIHWGFINPKETKVLEAIRSKDFQSILIKINADETMVIEATIETDLKDDKAKQVRRILGLKEYEEITIKYRNEKHLYIKNTQRL
jgi:DNA-binding transcriptional MerR regulator